MNNTYVTVDFHGKLLKIKTHLLQDVGQLKDHIDVWYDIPSATQHLFSGENELQDDIYIQDVPNLKAGLKLLIDHHNDSYDLLTVAINFDYRWLEVVAHHLHNVGQLKDLIELWHGIASNKQRLFVGENELENETSILDAGYHYGVTLKLPNSNDGLMQLKVVLPDGNFFTALYHGTQTVQYLREDIRTKTKGRYFPAHLRWEGVALCDAEMTLFQCGLQNNSTINC